MTDTTAALIKRYVKGDESVLPILEDLFKEEGLFIKFDEGRKIVSIRAEEKVETIHLIAKGELTEYSKAIVKAEQASNNMLYAWTPGGKQIELWLDGYDLSQMRQGHPLWFSACYHQMGFVISADRFTERSGMKVTQNLEEVTCGACRRSRIYKTLQKEMKENK